MCQNSTERQIRHNNIIMITGLTDTWDFMAFALLTFPSPHLEQFPPGHQALGYSLFLQKQTQDIPLLWIFQLSNTVIHPYWPVPYMCAVHLHNFNIKRHIIGQSNIRLLTVKWICYFNATKTSTTQQYYIHWEFHSLATRTQQNTKYFTYTHTLGYSYVTIMQKKSTSTHLFKIK